MTEWFSISPDVVILPLNKDNNTYIFARRISPLCYEVQDLGNELIVTIGYILHASSIAPVLVPN